MLLVFTWHFIFLPFLSRCSTLIKFNNASNIFLPYKLRVGISARFLFRGKNLMTTIKIRVINVSKRGKWRIVWYGEKKAKLLNVIFVFMCSWYTQGLIMKWNTRIIVILHKSVDTKFKFYKTEQRSDNFHSCCGLWSLWLRDVGDSLVLNCLSNFISTFIFISSYFLPSLNFQVFLKNRSYVYDWFI